MRKIIRLTDDNLNPRGQYNKAAGNDPDLWGDFMGLSSHEIMYAHTILYHPEHGESKILKQRYSNG